MILDLQILFSAVRYSFYRVSSRHRSRAIVAIIGKLAQLHFVGEDVSFFILPVYAKVLTIQGVATSVSLSLQARMSFWTLRVTGTNVADCITAKPKLAIVITF